jgi:glycosyltransferase involved in cell wall biosynthesis
MESHRRLLAGAGYPVRVVSGRGAGEVVPELDSRHPEVEAITRCLAAGEVPADRFEALRVAIGRRLDEVLAGVDLVIAHNVPTMHFNLPLTAALAGRRVLSWTHDLAWSNPRYAEFRRDGFPYELLHESQPGTRYVAISERVRGQLEDVYSVSAEVVHNGIDRLSLLRVRDSTQSLLAGAGLLDADPLVFVPVRVTRRKRLELAIEAAALLAERLPDLKVVVSGPLGPHSADNRRYWAELEGLRTRLGVEARVVFLHQHGDPHPVDEEMVGELYQLAGAVLLTSESEGFGLPVLEAGLLRVPVVCTDLDVFREVAGELAWTFPVEAGAIAVADALQAALDVPTARLQRRVGEDFDWRHILPRVEREIELALN